VSFLADTLQAGGVGAFPRLGIALWEPPPSITKPAVLRVAGVVAHPLALPVSRLAELSRRDVVADFHCVTDWSVQGLRWSGVAFRTFYDMVIVHEAGPHPGVSHILFEEADGFRATLTLEDALDADVVLADQLGGAALSGEYGASLRLLSPKQYAYKSAKHLCRIRARGAQEERHRKLQAWAVGGIYRHIRRLWIWTFAGRR
jgi:DMSO/TMAO reductase YedYZ molybdopterin-dependent catalytic subunit